MNYKTLQIDTLTNLEKLDSSFVGSNKYLVGNGEAKFIYYEVIGGGHDWPGAWGNQDINASEEIWQFFAKYLQ